MARNQYDTDPEADARVFAAVQEHGSMNAAARALGMVRSTVQDAVKRHRKRMGDQFGAGGIGAGPERDGGAPYIVRGVSTYFDAEGNQRGQWVKTRLDDELRQAAMKAAADALALDLPRVAPMPPPVTVDRDLCNLFTITDYHMGMLAQRAEGGADWDLKIADATFTAGFGMMVAQSPSAGLGIVNIQGDFLHTDGMTPVTPTHGHILDADSRFQKIAAASVRAIRRAVDMALAKHERVLLVICEGNHDETSSIWLRIMFAALYENEPRVMVDTSALPFYAHQFGRVMLAFHHGHKVKNEALPMLFAAQFPAMWGATTKRYAHCGHRHHVDEKEYSGMLVTQHPTLAARDAYAARGGWISERAAQAITYHAEYGQVARAIVCPEMLRVAA